MPIYSGSRRLRGGGFLGFTRQRFSPMKSTFLRTPKRTFTTMKPSFAKGVRKSATPIKGVKKTVAPLTRVKKTSLPIKSSIIKGAKSVVKSKAFKEIGRKALEKGAEVAASVAVDALTGRHVGQSIKERSREAALRTLTGQDHEPSHSVQVRRKLKQKKRPAPSSTVSSAPSAKRRRKARSRAARNRKQLF